MIGALDGPTIRVFSGMVDGHPTTALFWNMIGLVLHVHVFLHEVAALVLKILTIQGKDLGK